MRTVANTKAQGKSAPKLSSRTPQELPSRSSLVNVMLDNSARGGVPIRRSFIQLLEKDEAGQRGSVLAKIVTSRDVKALDAYLLMHAVASKEPWMVNYPVAVWARALGLDEDAEPAAARTHWSKIAAKLVRLGLIARSRQGNRSIYQLLDESGDLTEYTRPRTAADHRWFSLPYAYWREGHDQLLTLPEKAMLLIVIDNKAGTPLVYDRMKPWYGISASTASRGLLGLAAKGFISMNPTYQVDPKSATGWIEVRQYTPLGLYSAASRKAAMGVRPRKAKPVFFEDPEEEAEEQKL